MRNVVKNHEKHKKLLRCLCRKLFNGRKLPDENELAAVQRMEVAGSPTRS